MTPKDIARYNWLSSQLDWHRKSLLRNRRWHRSQILWYSKEIGTLPNVFSWITLEVLRKNAPRIAANVVANNALFERMKHANRTRL